MSGSAGKALPGRTSRGGARLRAWAGRHRVLLGQAGGAAFGALLACLITSAIKSGAREIFIPESDKWGCGFWGSHHALRIVASSIGTAIGACAAGCTAGGRGAFWGILSTLPRTLFWLGLTIVTLARAAMGGGAAEITWGHWASAFILFVTTPALGAYLGTLGARARAKYPAVFAIEPNSALGVAWYHWIWLLFVVQWVVMMGSFAVLEGVLLFTAGSKTTAWSGINPFVAGFTVVASLAFLAYAMYQILSFLIFGRIRGWTKGEITVRILGWVGGILVVFVAFNVVSGFMRVL